MKRNVLFIAVLLILSFAVTTCGSTPKVGEADGLSLLEAVEQSADRIATELPAGSRVAILSFETDSPQLSAFIMEELAGALFDRGIEIADRQNLDVIYRELTFQMSGDVSDATVQSIGKFLGAEMVITGQMRPLGSTYRFTANAIHVESATRASIPRLTVRNNREIQSMIAALNQQTGTGGVAAASQSESAIAEARVAEVRAAAERIAAEPATTPEAQAVAALAAEALAAAEARAEQARRTTAAAQIPAPTGLTATVANAGEIRLTWNAISGADSYKVYRSTSANEGFTLLGSVNTPAYTDSRGLSGNTVYYYRVTTVMDDTESRQFVTANARTPQAPVTPPPGTLAEQLAWIGRQGGNGTIYDIIVYHDTNIGPTTVTSMGVNTTVSIRSANAANIRTIQLEGQGHLFSVDGITLQLQNIELKGHGNNNRSLVLVDRGTLVLNSGAKIMGNTHNSSEPSRGGGGIHVNAGTLEMNDGSEISGNTIRGSYNIHGGGIYIENRGRVTMRGGIIARNRIETGNSAAYGGGVYIGESSSFTKQAVSGDSGSGIIYGSVGNNANVATSSYIRDGHAISYKLDYYNQRQRNTTLGPGDEISTASNAGWGQ